MGTLIASHSYPTLNQATSQIRLIRLQPGLENEKLTCLLYIADLKDKACKYEALSYEWGEATSNSMHISLDGVHFDVRENLWWALYYLRDKEIERILWIDALCIDQNNEGERNHQVGLMGQIYAGAWRVVAWLGREDQEDFAKAVDLVNLLNGDSEKTGYHIQAQPQCPRAPLIWVNDSTNAKLSMDPVTLPGETNHHLGWLSWKRIFCRTYWSRLWIIQELVLAKELVLRCGNVELDWEAVSYILGEKPGPRPGSTEKPNGEPVHPSHNPKPRQKPVQNLSKPGSLAQSDVPYRIHQRRSGIYGREPNSFTTLFDQFVNYREAKCADVRDRIFGLRGISSKCCQDSIPADYGMSPIELALAVINHDERKHQGFREGLTSSVIRAQSFIEYLGCKDDGQRIVTAIEAFDGPLWPPFGTPEEEQELWRWHDSSIVTWIEGGKLVLRFPKRFNDSEEDENIEESDDSKESKDSVV